MSLWRRVRKDFVLLGIGSIAAVIGQLAFRSVALVRLSADSYGHLTLLLSLYNTVMIVGASGLPNTTARYLAALDPEDDRPVIRAALKAATWPIVLAALIAASSATMLLHSIAAGAFTLVALPSLIYSLLATGILRGRGYPVYSACVQPVISGSQVVLVFLLVLLWSQMDPVSAFAAFCLGNVSGLIVGGVLVARTSPRRSLASGGSQARKHTDPVPTPRELLGFSTWLGAATIGVALLPLIMRSVAVFSSYRTVAMVDVALVLLTIPQRVGVVLVQAVIPHATRAVRRSNSSAIVAIARREQGMLIAPFLLLAGVAAFTPLVHLVFAAVGKDEYSQSAGYLSLALLAGPPRILYGLAQGVLVAHGEGRFMARNAWTVTAFASLAMLGLAAAGSVEGAFAVFVVACWAIYVFGARRLARIQTRILA